MRRIRQVLKFGWIHAGHVAAMTDLRRVTVFVDILRSYYKYKMWSNQYVEEKFYELTKSEKNKIGRRYLEKGIIRDAWQRDFMETREFLHKYSSKKYEIGHRRIKRRDAYAKRFNAGQNLAVEYDVNISRQHYLNGSISIGDNVLLAKHVFIDYSGDVIIKDNVRLTNGVIIETHLHKSHSDYKCSRSEVVGTKLIIEEGAVIGSRAIIMPTCSRIGKHARVGAGAVVTKDVPDFAVVVGIPARIIRYQD